MERLTRLTRCAFAALVLLDAALLTILIGRTDVPHPPAPPAIPSWRRIPSYRWTIADGATLVLRFAPDAVGLPSMHTAVDAGAASEELWYLPWIHDHPDPAAEPLPTSYIAALADALVHFGARVDVVGIEGELWGWDVRDADVSPYAEEVLGADAVDEVRMLQEVIAQEEALLSPLLSIVPAQVDRATDALLSYTTTPVVGIEDPDLLIPTDAEERSQTIDLDRSRERSRTTIAVLLSELEVRRGRRALLIFGMEHYVEIEDKVRKLGNVTLRVACIPALCASVASARARH